MSATACSSTFSGSSILFIMSFTFDLTSRTKRSPMFIRGPWELLREARRAAEACSGGGGSGDAAARATSTGRPLSENADALAHPMEKRNRRMGGIWSRSRP